MKLFLKRASIALLAAVVLAGTAACAPTATTGKAGKPSPSASPTPEPCAIEDQESLGDAVVKGPVEDEFGVYCSLTVNPELASEFISYEDSNVASKYSEEEFNAAKKAALEFFVESIDSTLLDAGKDEAAYAAWLKDSSLAERWHEASLEQYENAELGGGYAFTNFFENPFPRTGQPRLWNVDVQPAGSELIEYEGKSYVNIRSTVTAVYTDTNENVIETIKRHSDRTTAEIKKDYPELFEAKENGFYEITFKSGVAFDPKGANAGKVEGFRRYYKANAANGPTFYEDEDFDAK